MIFLWNSLQDEMRDGLPAYYIPPDIVPCLSFPPAFSLSYSVNLDFSKLSFIFVLSVPLPAVLRFWSRQGSMEMKVDPCLLSKLG